MPSDFLTNWLVKWRILLTTLPFTGLFCLAKWLTHQYDWEVWQFDSLTSSLFGAATLVIAFILSGNLADYRDSERVPVEISSAIEAIHDTNLLMAATKPDYNPKPVLQALIHLLQQIHAWLQHNHDSTPLLHSLTDLNRQLAPLQQVTEAPLMGRVQAEQNRLRQLILQIQYVRDNTFISPAYLLLELFILTAAVSLLLVQGDTFIASLVISAFLFTAFLYLLFLIRDLDNPFEYYGHSSADVPLVILATTGDRLQQQLSTLEHQ